jgi:hypothetical protein
VLQAQLHYSLPEHASLLLTLLLLLLAMIQLLLVLLAVAVLLTQAQPRHRTNTLWIHNVKDIYTTYNSCELLIASSSSSSTDWIIQEH